MGKSIKRSVSIRVACAIAAILLFSVITTINILRIEGTQESSIQARSMLDQAQKAEAAHYKWSSNLSNALYAGTEFTGSMDHTGCVLGKWLYSDPEFQDASINQLRSQIEPLHRELHASAGTALEMLSTSPTEAQRYYRDTIQVNLTTLVGLLDQVVERAEVLDDAYTKSMTSTIMTMHLSTSFSLLLNLIALISLVVYVLTGVVKPLLLITQ